MMILLKRVLDSGFVDVQKAGGDVFIGGMQTNPDYILLTDRGRAFLADLGIHEL